MVCPQGDVSVTSVKYSSVADSSCFTNMTNGVRALIPANTGKFYFLNFYTLASCNTARTVITASYDCVNTAGKYITSFIGWFGIRRSSSLLYSKLKSLWNPFRVSAVHSTWAGLDFCHSSMPDRSTDQSGDFEVLLRLKPSRAIYHEPHRFCKQMQWKVWDMLLLCGYLGCTWHAVWSQ